jgi:hypothetical protein
MPRGKKPSPANESKSQKWSRLANYRLRVAIKGIDGLSQLATTVAYERTPQQVELPVKALRASVDRCEQAYANDGTGTEIPVR